jgi:hypothetical protein
VGEKQKFIGGEQLVGFIQIAKRVFPKTVLWNT